MMNDPNSQFVRLLSRHHHEIYTYILSLHPNHADADDIMQETASSLWKRVEEYDETRGAFLPWAYRFAYYEVLRFRKTLSRSKLVFDDALLGKISQVVESSSDEQQRKEVLLGHCINQLSQQDRQLVEGRYDSKTTIALLAKQIQLPVKKLYKRLEHIRLVLFQCVDSQMNRERSLS